MDGLFVLSRLIMGLKRKNISKKKRFEVFKRDGFTCQYCGKTPPETKLEIDHIKPVSLGGGNSYANLITSCFSCNRGKTNEPLIETQSTPDHLPIDDIISQEEAFSKYKINKLFEREKYSESLNNIYKSKFKKDISEEFRLITFPIFFRRLDFEEIEEAMCIAVKRIDGEDDCLQYFCGVCWRKINGTSRW